MWPVPGRRHTIFLLNRPTFTFLQLFPYNPTITHREVAMNTAEHQLIELGYYGNKPIHAVVAQDSANGDCHMVTIYWPNPAIWDERFKKRRS
jgi:hypothetical protein